MQNEPNSAPAVSVIIPNYNHAAYLEQRIRSVLLQSYTDFELIILDDASTDSSVDIIKKLAIQDSRISFYPSMKNSGSPFIQWNKGVALAKSNLIWIAESDDVALPDFLQVMVSLHTAHPGIGLAFCQSNRMNDEGTITGTWETFTDNFGKAFSIDFVTNGMSFIERFLIHKNVIPNASGVLFKKSVYKEVGGADERLKTNSDWLTWLKMLLKHDVAFVSRPLNNFRYHSLSVIARIDADGHENYKEQYDLTLRSAFIAYCTASSVVLPGPLVEQNKKYQSFDYGNKGIFEIKKGAYLRGLIHLFRASLFPRPTLGFFIKLINSGRTF